MQVVHHRRAVCHAGLSVVGYDNTTLAAVSHLSLSSVDPRSTDIGAS